MDDENNGLDLGGGAEPGPDPFAQVPPDAEDIAADEGGAGLGGEGATLEDLQAEQAAEEEAAADAAVAEGDPEPLPEGPAAEKGEETPPAEEPEPEPTPPEPEPEPEPEPPAEPPAPEPNGSTKKEGTAERPYVVLVKDTDDKWDYATPEPITAANGEVALKQAYAELVKPEEEKEVELVVVPVHYWKPRKVAAKKQVSRAVEIS